MSRNDVLLSLRLPAELAADLDALTRRLQGDPLVAGRLRQAEPFGALTRSRVGRLALARGLAVLAGEAEADRRALDAERSYQRKAAAEAKGGRRGR